MWLFTAKVILIEIALTSHHYKMQGGQDKNSKETHWPCDVEHVTWKQILYVDYKNVLSCEKHKNVYGYIHPCMLVGPEIQLISLFSQQVDCLV